MRPRQIVGAAPFSVGLVLALLFAACSPSAVSPTPAGAGAAAVASTAGSSSDPALAPADGSSDPASEPTDSAQPSKAAGVDRLAATLKTISAGYTYAATVTVASKPVSSARGRSVRGASEFTLTSGGKSVTYRAIPPKAWVKQSGGSWVIVTGKVPTGSPLAGLMKPATTTVVDEGTSGLTVDATYPANVLGLAGTKPVRVRLVVATDGTLTATFTTRVGNDTASSTSVFTAASGLDPIVAPSS